MMIYYGFEGLVVWGWYSLESCGVIEQLPVVPLVRKAFIVPSSMQSNT